MSSPPPYSKGADSNRDRLPPYKASHAFVNSQEELAALREFAESKMYVEPGTNGTLPDIRGGMGMKSLAWGGPMQTGNPQSGGFAGLTPETDEERKQRRAEEKAQKKVDRERRGSVAHRLVRVLSGGSKDGTAGSSK